MTMRSSRLGLLLIVAGASSCDACKGMSAHAKSPDNAVVEQRVRDRLPKAKEIASQMLGMMLVTHQTGPEGREVKTLLIEEGLPIDREFYLAVTLDRVTGRNVFMASSAGGMDIEKVAEETPELILKETIDPSVGLRPFQARKLAFGLGIPADPQTQDLNREGAGRSAPSLHPAIREAPRSQASRIPKSDISPRRQPWPRRRRR